MAYRASVINVLKQFQEFNCTIVCHDDLGNMPEWRQDYSFPLDTVNETFISNKCDEAEVMALSVYNAGRVSEY